MKKRLFAGVRLTPALQDVFRVYVKKLHGSNFLENRNIRWTHEKNLHLTLCFLGSIPVEHIPAIAETLTGIAAKSVPIGLRFDGIAWGPPVKPARMIWGNFFPDTAFTQLARDIARALESDRTGGAGRKIRLRSHRENF